MFYESPFGNPPHIHGKLQGIPKVVIGMDSQHLVSLADTWMDDDQLAMQNHLFLNILWQIKLQADVYKEVAKKHSQSDIADRYEMVEKVVSRLHEEQKAARGVKTMTDIAPTITNDLVHRGIISEAGALLQ